MIVRVSEVLRRTMVCNGDGRFKNESESYHQSQVNVLGPVIGHDWSVSILW